MESCFCFNLIRMVQYPTTAQVHSSEFKSSTTSPCPLHKYWLSDVIVFSANITTVNSFIKSYIGLTWITFKTRYSQLPYSPRISNKVVPPLLYIWKLKPSEINNIPVACRIMERSFWVDTNQRCDYTVQKIKTWQNASEGFHKQ